MTKELQSKGVGKMTEAQRELLASSGDRTGYAYCGYSKDIRATARQLELRGFGVVGENDCGPIFRINNAGRAALKAGEK